MSFEDEINLGGDPNVTRNLVLPNQQLVPVNQADRSLSKEGKVILKNQLRGVYLWLGKRNDDFSDLEKFRSVLDSPLGVPLIGFEIPDADKIGEEYSALQPVGIDFAGVLEKIKSPLVVFILTTPEVAELSWLQRFPQNLRQYRNHQGRSDTFIYKMVVEGFGFTDPYEMLPEDPQGRFTRYELKSHQLGGVYFKFDTDYPTKSSRRLVEFMKRVVGADLPGREFPDYPWEDIARIAWHINREDFGIYEERDNAIPKYPIVNGKPEFSF